MFNWIDTSGPVNDIHMPIRVGYADRKVGPFRVLSKQRAKCSRRLLLLVHACPPGGIASIWSFWNVLMSTNATGPSRLVLNMSS